MSDTHAEPTPLEILDEILDKEGLPDAGKLTQSVSSPPPLISMADLKTPPQENDPNELIKNRFFCKGGIMLLVAMTGVGKSSFSRQLALNFALGREMFGIVPGDCYREET